jgi:hypothetical protein
LIQGLIDSAPTASPVVASLTRSVLIASSVNDSSLSEVLSVHTMLPVTVHIPATVSANSGFLRVLVGGVLSSVDAATSVGELVFSVDRNLVSEEPVDLSAVLVSLSVSTSGEITVMVTQTASQVVIGSLIVPAAV